MEKGNNTCCSSLTASSFTIILVGIISLVVLRVVYVLYRSGRPRHAMSLQRSFNTLIVLGSGGHTAEMLNLLIVLEKNRFEPRHYIAAATDNMSLQKAQAFENSLHQKGKIEGVGTAQFFQIYRSREVGQSYITSVATTLIALAHALWLMIKIRPEVILCNGPGTCVPLCIIAFLFKVFGIRWSCIFYVESIARVRRLSLSALLLYKLRVADQLFVQWPQLKSKYPRAHYVGCLIYGLAVGLTGSDLSLLFVRFNKNVRLRRGHAVGSTGTDISVVFMSGFEPVLIWYKLGMLRRFS